MAVPFLRRNMDCVIIEYRLMPDFRLEQLIEDAVSGLEKVEELSQKYDFSQNKIVCGHSAGAHLSLYGVKGLEKRGVAIQDYSLLLFSGIFDLLPIIKTSIGKHLQLSSEDVRSWSLQLNSKCPVDSCVFCVGENETDEFKRQTYLAATLMQLSDDNIILGKNMHHLGILTGFNQSPGFSNPIIDRVMMNKRLRPYS